MTYFIIIVANVIVGAFVGLTGVAGFLLPMLYAGGLQMSVPEGLSLSFAAFVLSGILGAINYKKAGNMDLSFGIRLSLGSLIGAILGVKLNLIIPEEQVKVLLYFVVLLSGISILVRKEQKDKEKQHGFLMKEHLLVTILLGFVTGSICALSGAGGPILVMPLLVVFGIPVRTAVGVALFNSIFIGIPACIGYMANCNWIALLPIFVIALAAHGIGVYYGSLNAVRINQAVLKKGIAIFSICIAVWKLMGSFMG